MSFLRFAADESTLIAGVGPDVCVWKIGEPTPTKLQGAGATLVDGDIASRGDIAVTLDERGSVRWWRIESGQSWSERGDHPGARTLSISSSAQFVATGSQNGTVRMFDRLGFTSLPNVEIKLDPLDKAPIDAVRFSRDDAMLFTASSRGVMRVWDVRRARLSAGVSASPLPGFGDGDSIAASARFALLTGSSNASVIDLETLATVSSGSSTANKTTYERRRDRQQGA